MGNLLIYSAAGNCSETRTQCDLSVRCKFFIEHDVLDDRWFAVSDRPSARATVLGFHLAKEIQEVGMEATLCRDLEDFRSSPKTKRPKPKLGQREPILALQ
jgi:hypothetical protein